MSANEDRIGLATADHWANITDQVYGISPRPVGYGGYSDIYTAMWRRVNGDMKVAVKVIRTVPTPFHGADEMPHALRREIRVWKRLLHRNIHVMCGFYDGYGPAPALVSPWYENGDINSYVRRRATDPNIDTIKFSLFADVMCGLRFCALRELFDVAQTHVMCCAVHDHYIVHADIKGGNVLISDDGVARLCDFGLSRVLLEHSQSVSHTGVKGTARWMAPELLLEEGGKHSFASDVWACGCLFIEVWSNVRPYHKKMNEHQVILALGRKEQPDRPADMPDVTWSMVTVCCDFDAVRRPAPSRLATYLSLHVTAKRLYRFIIDRAIDHAAAALLKDIEVSLKAVDPLRLSELYSLSDADLAIEVIRYLSLRNLTLPLFLRRFDGTISQWCLAELGIGSVIPPAGVELPTLDEKDFMSRCNKILGLCDPVKLRPFARLVERAHPGLAKDFTTRFAARMRTETAFTLPRYSPAQTVDERYLFYFRSAPRA